MSQRSHCWMVNRKIPLHQLFFLFRLDFLFVCFFFHVKKNGWCLIHRQHFSSENRFQPASIVFFLPTKYLSWNHGEINPKVQKGLTFVFFPSGFYVLFHLSKKVFCFFVFFQVSPFSGRNDLKTKNHSKTSFLFPRFFWGLGKVHLWLGFIPTVTPSTLSRTHGAGVLSPPCRWQKRHQKCRWRCGRFFFWEKMKMRKLR